MKTKPPGVKTENFSEKFPPEKTPIFRLIKHSLRSNWLALIRVKTRCLRKDFYERNINFPGVDLWAQKFHNFSDCLNFCGFDISWNLIWYDVDAFMTSN